MQLLQTMEEHGAVMLSKNVLPDLDHEVGTNAHDVAVESRMMNLAQRKTVGNDWIAVRMSIGQDVGGIKEFKMAESADRATLSVSEEHAFAELRLVHSALRQDRNVFPSDGGCGFCHQRCRNGELAIVNL